MKKGGMNMEKMKRIERLCRRYVDARDARDRVADVICTENRKIVRKNLRDLRQAVARMTTAEEALRQAIADAKELFDRPRTRAIDGVKVGYQKAKGKVEMSSEENTIRLIRKKLPRKAATLIVKSEKVDKNALKKLTVRDLAMIGATLGDDTDKVVLTLAATDLEKFVGVLMEEYKDEKLEDAA